MDALMTRWAQIVWLDRDDILGLHHRELLSARRSGQSNSPRFVQEGRETWMEVERIIEMTRRISPNGYWPRDMTEAERSVSMEVFGRAIYPIWKGILERDIAAENLLTMAEVNAPGQVLFETLTVHKQDLAIFGSGIKPHRQSSDQAKMADLRRRSTRSFGK
jgi:hypothetical protein